MILHEDGGRRKQDIFVSRMRRRERRDGKCNGSSSLKESCRQGDWRPGHAVNGYCAGGGRPGSIVNIDDFEAAIESNFYTVVQLDFIVSFFPSFNVRNLVVRILLVYVT